VPGARGAAFPCRADQRFGCLQVALRFLDFVFGKANAPVTDFGGGVGACEIIGENDPGIAVASTRRDHAGFPAAIRAERFPPSSIGWLYCSVVSARPNPE
jgi:hypothetical protein